MALSTKTELQVLTERVNLMTKDMVLLQRLIEDRIIVLKGYCDNRIDIRIDERNVIMKRLIAIEAEVGIQ